jgi:hypothetical protein
MCLSIAYWLKVHNIAGFELNISIYDLDESTVNPIVRINRILPHAVASDLLSDYFVQYIASVCLGQPSHLIVFHYQSIWQQVLQGLLRYLTPSRSFVTLRLITDIVSDSETALSSPKSLYPLTLDSPYSVISNPSSLSYTSLSDH